jgi:hypothetical protein
MYKPNWPSLLLVLAMLFASTAVAEELPQDEARQDTAAAKETSRFGSFLALPIFITEPAIGEGLGLGLVYFHKDDKADTPVVSTPNSLGKSSKKSKPPPTATGIFGFYTSNQTAGVGLGHSGSYFDDKLRVVGALASLQINAALFLSDLPVNFGVDGELVYLNFEHRLGDSNFFLGMSALSMNADADFKIGVLDPNAPSLVDFSFQTTGLAGSVAYDSRDDTMMPGQGQLFDLTLWRYDEAIGSDFDYWSLRFKAHSFHQLSKRWVLGLRLDVSTVEDDPPFFAVPYVSLRGIPAMRYQAKTAGTVEIEGRYNFGEKWAGVAFAGAGFTNSGDPVLDTDDTINAFGVGLRFRALKEQNVWLGLDIAKGPEEYAWYIQMGHPW